MDVLSSLHGQIIDFHTHVLPGMDDGSRSGEESLQMLREMKAQGFHTVVATPHFYASHDFPENFLQRRENCRQHLLRKIESCGGAEDLPVLCMGAEVAYFRGMSQSRVLQHLTIGQSRFILVEMPMGRWTDSMYEELEQIHLRQGLVPVVAHVDRYFGRFRDYGIPQALAGLPVLVQANASFFLGSSGHKAIRMLERDQIHLLGSDAHNMSERAPQLGLAVQEILKHGAEGEEALARVAAWQEKILPGMQLAEIV